ncbi:hypothetical protein Cylst_2923 [Cylindrospermum stagnale PCC 7417]|uniref:Uncharacterized protein n=1 Tax=Cylindrospermum stagnale PCC 7417 TaxID=56107 RepID=K9WZ83_9NOST|nr:hypothetical protein [Cylindrospermum stagnale]AFZ25096.1 hypothetical protein Cylst_2923 [Cylindrospermum stagnale PCC 7417]
MKFSVKSAYPISTSLSATNCQFSWESAAMGVEYLFIGSGGRDHRQNTESHYDFRYISINGLNAKPQLDKRSGGYRKRNTVPI